MGKLTVTFPRAIRNRIVEVTATRNPGSWGCDDNELLEALDLLRLPWQDYYPDSDLAMAQLAAKTFGGRIEDARPPETVKPGVFY